MPKAKGTDCRRGRHTESHRQRETERHREPHAFAMWLNVVVVVQGLFIARSTERDISTQRLIQGSNNESSWQVLEGLASRFAEYYRQGARFSKWTLALCPLLNNRYLLDGTIQ